MDKIISLLHYIKGQKLYSLLRNVLNIVFVVSICSVIFEKYYFKYTLLDFTDYKLIYNFFINGNFIVPFGLFFIVWGVTYFIGFSLFTLSNVFIEEWIEKKLEAFIDGILRNSSIYDSSYSERQRKSFAMAMYRIFSKKKMTKDVLTKFSNYIINLKLKLASNFVVLFRAIIAISIYYATISFFGGLLFTVLLVIAFCAIVLFYLSYQIPSGFIFLSERFMNQIGARVKEMER